MSTLALEGSDGVGSSSLIAAALRWADIVVLIAALPVFIFAELPIVGYFVIATAWIAQRTVHYAADRHTKRLLGEGNRRAAMGTTGASSLARVWILTMSVLLVGLLSSREDGLAAAILAAILFTIFMATHALARLFEPESEVSR